MKMVCAVGVRHGRPGDPACRRSLSPTAPSKRAEKTNTFFTAFTERSPKYLDPTASYSQDETPYTYAVYERLRFHYLKRPYEVAPRTAEPSPPRYYDKQAASCPPMRRRLTSPSPSTTSDQQGIRYRRTRLCKNEPASTYQHSREGTRDKRTPFDFTPGHARADGGTTTSIDQPGHDRISPVFSPMASTSRTQGIRRVISRKTRNSQRQTVTDRNLPPRLQAVSAAGRRHSTPHAAHRCRAVTAVQDWLTMSFFSRSVGSRQLLCQRHERAQLSMNLLARNRPLHVDRIPGRNRPTCCHAIRTSAAIRIPAKRAADKAAGSGDGKTIRFIDKVVFSIEKKNPTKTKFPAAIRQSGRLRLTTGSGLDYDVKFEGMAVVRERGSRCRAAGNLSMVTSASTVDPWSQGSRLRSERRTQAPQRCRSDD